VLPQLSKKEQFIAMFLDEARLSAHLSHSNVVSVFDIGVGDGTYFIVMEYVEGADLKAVMDHYKKIGEHIPVEAACYIATRICQGLGYAHELKNAEGKPLDIIHRDITPANVLITRYGEVKIVDFGLAKASSQLAASDAGVIKGKFGYLSPEAAQGLEIDLRTDIFAVGIILWEMLSGRRLFLGETDFGTVKMVQQAVIPDLHEINPSVPPDLVKIIARSLAREPAARYGSARDFGRDLTSFLYRHGRPVTSYDIAELVRAAVAQRRKLAPEKSSIIDKLIEEALLEFTSLQDDKAPPAAPGVVPVELKVGGFEDIGSWANELSVPAPGPAPRKPMPSQTYEEGNLAALEETDPRMRAPAKPEKTSDAPAAPAPRPAELTPVVARKSNMTAVMVVVVALAVLAAGAWFGGLIPH
jgi:serine/threonine-protein kinase